MGRLNLHDLHEKNLEAMQSVVDLGRQLGRPIFTSLWSSRADRPNVSSSGETHVPAYLSLSEDTVVLKDAVIVWWCWWWCCWCRRYIVFVVEHLLCAVPTGVWFRCMAGDGSTLVLCVRPHAHLSARPCLPPAFVVFCLFASLITY